MNTPQYQDALQKKYASLKQNRAVVSCLVDLSSTQRAYGLPLTELSNSGVSFVLGLTNHDVIQAV